MIFETLLEGAFPKNGVTWALYATWLIKHSPQSGQQYQNALKDGGHDYKSNYKSKEETKRRHLVRQRNITWLNQGVAI